MVEEISKKVIITAALAGVAPLKHHNPNIPYTAEEFGNEAKKCLDAGASIVHLHFRDPQTGSPTPDLEIIQAGLENIISKCPDILINLSTAITPNISEEERIKPVQTFNIEENHKISDLLQAFERALERIKNLKRRKRVNLQF